MTTAEIMSPDPITVAMDATLLSIDQLFRTHHFHHVMVTSEGRLVGVISDRDLLRHMSPFVRTLGEQARDTATLKLHAHQIMTRRPITVTPQTDTLDAAEVMIKKRISCLPVLSEDHELVGVVTWRDVLRSVVTVARETGHVQGL